MDFVKHGGQPVRSKDPATPVTFDKAGDFTILCAIHPRMKLMVKVNN